MDKNQIKTPPCGDIVIQTLAMPMHTNYNGDIFGGWVMSQMDMAAGIIAAKHSRKRAATVAVDSLIFHRPVKVGDAVTCYGELVKVGRTSMTIKIETWVTSRLTQDHEKVTEGTFVFVAIDEHGRPTPVES